MIVNWTDIETESSPFAKTFKGRVSEDPHDSWEGRIPDITTLKDSIALDPALAAQVSSGNLSEFASVAEIKNSGLTKYIGDLAMADFIDGTRDSLGQVVRGAGILTTEISPIATILTSDKNDIIKGFDVGRAILDSKVFEMAMDAIGAVPIVGWIAKIILEIGKSIAGIVASVRKNKVNVAKMEMARELTIPIKAIKFTPDTDDAQTRSFFRQIGNVRGAIPQTVIMPPYDSSATPKNSDAEYGMFSAADVKDKESDDLRLGWIISGVPSGGMGFVPGTSSVTRAMYFRAGLSSAPNTSSKGCNGGSVRDIGTLYPTATNLATQWWSTISKPGPSMFSVDPLMAKDAWETYMENMFALAQNIMLGWVCAPTGKAFTNRFHCIGKTIGMGSCANKRKGDLLNIPPDFGRAAHTNFYSYLAELFFGIRDLFDQSKGGKDRIPHLTDSYYQNDLGFEYLRPDAINYDRSVPSEALEALHGRQKAVLKSAKCMYVNGRDPERFGAFRSAEMKQLWEDSVTAILNSDDWKMVRFSDVPDGDAKNAFYQVLVKNGIKDPENFDGKLKMQQLKQVSVLGDPEPPSMPAINGAVVANLVKKDIHIGGGKKRKSSKKSSNLPIMLAAGAIGVLALKNR